MARIESDSDDEPASKKKATTVRKGKNSSMVGKLEAFKAVPFDVFAEVRRRRCNPVP